MNLGRHLSFANVASATALSLVLGGGVAVAAGLAPNSVGSKQIKSQAVKSSDIKKNAVKGKHIKNDTVTGKDVKESSLAQVPSAAKAGSAGSAGSVNGVTLHKVSYRAEENTAAVVVYQGHGLTVTAACPGGNASLRATTSQTNASIYAFAMRDINPVVPLEADEEGGGFDTTVNFDLLIGTPGNISMTDFQYTTVAGAVVSGQLVSDVATPAARCNVTGMIQAG
jgi:hypothetical protein